MLSSRAYVAFAFACLSVVGCDNRGSGPTTPHIDGGPPIDAPTCTDECTAGTPPRCAGSGYQTCAHGADGCNRWSDITACGADQTCMGAGICMGTGCPGGCCPHCDGTMCGPNSDGCGGTCECGAGQACSDANTCCTPENGAAACNRILTQWCARIVMCCTAAGPDVCIPEGYDNTMCRAFFLNHGLDCASPTWTGSAYCMEGISTCVNDVRLVACADITGGTANFPASCPIE